MDTLFQNGTALTPHGQKRLDILVKDGRICQMAPSIAPASCPDCRRIDCTGLLLLPGLVDAHVHFTPGTADDFVSGSTAAAFGGVTTVVGYAGPKAGESLLQGLARKRGEAEGRSYVDYSFHVELPGWYSGDLEELQQFPQAGVSSLKIYTTYGEDRLPEERISDLLRRTRKLGLLVTVHAEDDALCTQATQALLSKGETELRHFAKSRPAESEAVMVEKLAALAREAGAPLHLVHISTKAAAKVIEESRRQGISLYGETCPQYLALDAECYAAENAALYLLVPPLRETENREALWQALKRGTFACITTDHCAFGREQKLAVRELPGGCYGLPGVETLLPLLYTQGVTTGRLTLEELVRLAAEQPAKLFGLYPQKGALQPGSDADVLGLDPAEERLVQAATLHSRAGYSPYEGWRLRGFPRHVMRRGELLVQDGVWTEAAPRGQFLHAGSWQAPQDREEQG